MKTLDVIQGSPEWFAGRLGKHRASRTGDMLAKVKSGWGASRKSYATELVLERLTNKMEQSFTTPAMQRGIDLEPKAKQAFELVHGCSLDNVGLVIHPTVKDFVASPDALIQDSKTLVEIKAPNSNTHIEYVMEGLSAVPNKYILQIQSQLACTGYEDAFFVSFDDRLPSDLSLFICKIERDNKLIDTIEKETEIFLREVSDTVETLKSKALQEAA